MPISQLMSVLIKIIFEILNLKYSPWYHALVRITMTGRFEPMVPVLFGYLVPLLECLLRARNYRKMKKFDLWVPVAFKNIFFCRQISKSLIVVFLYLQSWFRTQLRSTGRMRRMCPSRRNWTGSSGTSFYQWQALLQRLTLQAYFLLVVLQGETGQVHQVHLSTNKKSAVIKT